MFYSSLMFPGQSYCVGRSSATGAIVGATSSSGSLLFTCTRCRDSTGISSLCCLSGGRMMGKALSRNQRSLRNRFSAISSFRFQWVAAIIRMSIGDRRGSPYPFQFAVLQAPQKPHLGLEGELPISSRIRVPPSARSKCPRFSVYYCRQPPVQNSPWPRRWPIRPVRAGGCAKADVLAGISQYR
jgi:hypothetical protein